jgi:hypothetical protein
MASIDLIKKFIKIYSSAQVAIDSNNKKTAEKKYQELLNMYNTIKGSKLDYSHKKIAYSQIQKVYKGINGIDTRRSINKYAIAAAVLIIMLSFVVVAKPSLFGLAILEKGLYGNEAPKWVSEQKTFELRGILSLELTDYFQDPDGDPLTFLTKHQKGLKLALMNTHLKIINDGAKGQVPIELIASDGRIIVRETIMLDVK